MSDSSSSLLNTTRRSCGGGWEAGVMIDWTVNTHTHTHTPLPFPWVYTVGVWWQLVQSVDTAVQTLHKASSGCSLGMRRRERGEEEREGKKRGRERKRKRGSASCSDQSGNIYFSVEYPSYEYSQVWILVTLCDLVYHKIKKKKYIYIYRTNKILNLYHCHSAFRGSSMLGMFSSNMHEEVHFICLLLSLWGLLGFCETINNKGWKGGK